MSSANFPRKFQKFLREFQKAFLQKCFIESFRKNHPETFASIVIGTPEFSPKISLHILEFSSGISRGNHFEGISRIYVRIGIGNAPGISQGNYTVVFPYFYL